MTLAVETAEFKIAHAYLGAVEGTIEPGILDSGKKIFGHRITFTDPAKGNEAMAAWPLTLIAADTGKVFTESIAVVGQPKTCAPVSTSAPTDLAIVLPQSDSLNVCIPQESVAVAGKSAGEVTSGELLGVVATAVTRPTPSTAVLTFADLPVFGPKSTIPGVTTLRVTLGKKTHNLAIKLSCGS